MLLSCFGKRKGCLIKAWLDAAAERALKHLAEKKVFGPGRLSEKRWTTRIEACQGRCSVLSCREFHDVDVKFHIKGLFMQFGQMGSDVMLPL